MRILLGTAEISRQIYDMADGFRQLGHEVETLMYLPCPFHPELRYDHLINPGAFWQQIGIANAGQGTPQPSEHALSFLNRLLQDFDVYIFQFASSILPNNVDFKMLKKRDKKIIAIFNGSDVRHWATSDPVWASFGLTHPPLYKEMRFTNFPITRAWTALRMAECYADAVVGIPSDMSAAVRPFNHFYLPVRRSLFSPRIPGRDVPVVVHAPSRRSTKGTEETLATFERMKQDGIAFEVRLLEQMPNPVVLEHLSDADIVVDHTGCPTHGMLGLEAMASGCALMSGNNYDLVPVPTDRPVVHITAENLYERLKKLIEDVPYRVTMAERGLQYVERYYDHVRVTEQMLGYLEHPAPDYYPSFVTQSFSAPADEPVPPHLQALTARVIRQWGMPAGVDPEDLAERGIIPPGALTHDDIPRWAVPDDEARLWGWSPVSARQEAA